MPAPVPAAASRPASRRRWLWLAGGLAGAVLLLVLALPAVAGPWVRNRILAGLAGSFRGEAGIQALSVSLGGSVRLRGLTLRGEDGLPVVSMARLDADVGWLALLGGRLSARIRLEDFELHIRRGPQGRLNLEDLQLEAAAPAAGAGQADPGPAGEALDFEGSLALHGGRILLHGPAGNSEFRDLFLEASAPGGGAPVSFRAGFQARGPQGAAGSFHGEGEWRSESSGSPAEAGLRFNLERLDLGRLPDLAALAGFSALRGRVDGTGGFRLAGGELTGEARLTVAAGRIEKPGIAPAELPRLAVTLRGEAGTGGSAGPEWTLEMDGGEGLALTGEGRLSRGTVSGWSGSLQGAGNLAGLQAALGGFLPVRADVRLAGTWRARAALEGGSGAAGRPWARAQALVGLEGFAVTDPGQGPLELAGLEAPRLVVRGGLDPASGDLQVEELALEAGPVQARGHGTLRGFADGPAAWSSEDAAFHLEADLDRLGTVLKGILAEGTALGGRLRADADVRSEEGKTVLSTRLEARGLRWQRSDAFASGPLDLDLSHSVLLTPGDPAPLHRLELRSGLAAGTASGRLDPDGRLLEAEARFVLHPAALGAWLEPEGVAPRLAGDAVALEARLAGAEPGLTVAATVSGSRLEWAADEEAGSARWLQQDFRGTLEAGLETAALRIDGGRWSSRTGQLTLSGRWPLHDGGPAELTAELAADLGRLLEDLGRPAGLEQKGAGLLEGHALLQGTGGQFDLTGVTRVRDLVIESPSANGQPARLEEPELRIEHQVRWRAARGDLDLRQLKVDSAFLHGMIRGHFLGLSSRTDGGRDVRVEQFTANLSYVPERLGVILEPWLPGRLGGGLEEQLEVTFSGRLADLDVLGALRASAGRAALGLGELEIAGLATSGRLEFGLEGEHTTATGRLQANGGELLLDADLDLGKQRPGDPPVSTLRLSVDKARASPGTAGWLSWMHPVFASAGETPGGVLRGLVSCSLDLRYAGVLPDGLLEAGLGALDPGALSGRLRFGLDGAALQGGPFLGHLFASLGLGGGGGVSLEPVTLSLREGRFHYDQPWNWTLAGTRTAFTGSVGIDRSLDLQWNVPVSAALAARSSALRLLEGRTLIVPIAGTLSEPRLDFGAAVQALAAEALRSRVEGRLGGQAGDAIREGLEGLLGKPQAARPPAPAPKETPAPEDLLRRADALYDLGRRAEAAALYREILASHRRSAVFRDNRRRIRERSREDGS